MKDEIAKCLANGTTMPEALAFVHNLGEIPLVKDKLKLLKLLGYNADVMARAEQVLNCAVFFFTPAYVLSFTATGGHRDRVPHRA